MEYYKENTPDEQACTLVRKPIDMASGKEIEKCKYVFFPGCWLSGDEPEIVIKAYDSLRHQHPDMALMLHCCQVETMKENWEALGRPVVVCACMGCIMKLKSNFPDIPTIPLYDLLYEAGIGGGCNHTTYNFYDPGMANHPEKTIEGIKETADKMGVQFTDDEDAPKLVYNIRIRDLLKKEGKDAVHILELIYGMGASNTHMIDVHDHGDGEDHMAEIMEAHDCDGNCSTCSGCGDMPSPPSPLPTAEEKMENRKMLKKYMLELFWNESE